MTGRIRTQTAVRRGLGGLEEGSSRVAAVFLLAFFVLLFGCRQAAAQEADRSDEPAEIILELSEDEPVSEESPTRKREMLDLPVPFLTDEEKNQKTGKESDEPVPRTSASESELWRTVRQLQSDLEMIKEELAQLRSEFRSLIPKEPDEEDAAKRTVNPFWITDVQLGQQKPD